MLLSSTRRIVAIEVRCAPVMNSSEDIRPVTQLSTNFYRIAKLEDPELDCEAALCLATEGLFHFARRGVSGLGNDLVLDRLALLIDTPQRLAIRRVHQIHLDLAVLAVARLVGGMVSQRILVAERIRDRAIDGGELAVEAREERLAAGFLCG